MILDGAMGTVLQARGLPPGGVPELLNLERPELLRAIYREYIDAGSEVIYANTFGANALKLARTGKSVAEVVSAAVALAKDAAAGTDVRVALDVGPLGELLEPLGTLRFERAYALFCEVAEAGAAAGADLAVIETMTDLAEARAALLAVKEATGLPTLVTMSFEANGRTFTGCTLASMARTLTGLGADAIGLNCSMGPDQLAPLLRELCALTPLPVIAKPNAGLPDPIDGHYDMDPETFADLLAPLAEAGVSVFGGCCGTSPDYVRALAKRLKGKPAAARAPERESFVCSALRPLPLRGVRVIGERINPTGKKRFQQALLEDDLDYIESVAVAQEDAG
ncbi:MAG: homocysteine methyltransferase, partial [Ruminococcaceae bacterium]|nr:homocysteine methyltransferase [Oscillospiraceae bacterium]